MADTELLSRTLQACAQSAPGLFFPAEYAAASGLPRQEVDAAIDRLRDNGYLCVVDWVKDKGQGYGLTEAGAAALAAPIELRRPAVIAPEPEPVTPRDLRWRRGEAARNALIAPGPPRVVFALIFANLATYAIGLVMALMRGVSLGDYLGGGRSLGPVLDTLGAVNTYHVIAEDQWWRLLSYQFLHAGLMHLGMNMLALYFLGPLLEAVWGSTRFLALYLISGLVGGAAVVMTSRAAVGASGPISGLMTSIAVWLWLNRDVLPERISGPMMSRVGTNLLLLVLISTMPRVSWEGHLGGAIGGVLVSVALQYQRFGAVWQKLLGWLALFAIPAAAVGLAYQWHAQERAAIAQERRMQSLARELHAAENGLFECRNRYIIPVLLDGNDGWRHDEKFVSSFKQACRKNLDRLQALQAELSDRVPRDEQEKQETANIQEYFAAWRELLQTLDRQLHEPQRWNPARRRHLAEKDDALFELRRPLETNSAMPRFPGLVNSPEQPQAKPPRNDVG